MESSYFGKTLLCRADNKGKKIPGLISISPKEVYTKLVDFENFSSIKDDDPVVLQLEDNYYCTVTPRPVSRIKFSSSSNRSCVCEFKARQAILGPRPWEELDRIKELYFNLSDTNGMLEAPDIKRTISSSQTSEEPDTKIIQATSNGATVTIHYPYSYNSPEDKYSILPPRGHVRFEKPKTSDEVRNFLNVLHTFFTMGASIQVRTSDYWIVAHEEHEQPFQNGETVPSAFQIIWPSGKERQPETDGRARPISILRCLDKEDRKATSDCLTFWIENWKEWEPAFWGIWHATRDENTFDPDRIINACKWLHKTPGTEQLETIDKEKLQEVKEAAQNKAKELGLDLRNRISQLFSYLETESRKELLNRLVDSAVKQEDRIPKEKFISDIHRAFEIRGKFAHHVFDHENNDEFAEFVRCTKAVEALAFLLLMRELPLREEYKLNDGSDQFTNYFNLLR